MANPGEKALTSTERRVARPTKEQTQRPKRYRSSIDWWFAGILLLLLAIGTIFVFSASYVNAKVYQSNSYHFIVKQIGWVIVSLGAMFFIIRYIDYLLIKKLNKVIFWASYILLVSVNFIGDERNGARRWLDFKIFDFQPSELVKFAVIVFIAAYVVNLDNKGTDLIRTIKHGIWPFLRLAILVGIPLVLQPHFSAIIIILGLIFCMMFLSGVKPSILFGGLFLVGVLMLIIIMTSSHGQARIEAWLNPSADTQDSGWQPTQALYAIGSGGLWGVGFGASKQKHLYLPEPQNDYIFAVICEEMGFVFATAVIILFLILIWRGFVIAKNAPSKFSSLLVMGIICQIAIQVFLNIGVVTRTLPSTGVSLPFFSYGGSSLLIFMAEMGVVLNVSKYSYNEKA